VLRPVAKRRFGVSTQLYRRERLCRAHLLEIAAHGFEAVEVFGARTHFDYYNPAAVADLQQWLAEARLDLDAVTAPPPDGPAPWNAGALEPVEQALFIARRIPMRVLILPIGAPKSGSKAVERVAAIAEPLGVTVAIDSRSPSMAAIGSLITFVERCEAAVSVALDFASAAKDGGLVDAIEMTSEHLAAVRVPADGAFDWAAVMTTVQKVGYENPLTIDMAPGGAAKDNLVRARHAREKMERWLTST
jgi:sugar phosphate isomerase/epimerase